jgi:hypothetical protein
MQSKSDFWLTLHHLANDLEREGDTDEDQIRSLSEGLRNASAAARFVYQENAAFVFRVLNALVVESKKEGDSGGENDRSG